MPSEHEGKLMRGLAGSVLVVTAFIIGVWLVTRLLGWHFSLIWSLLLSVGLTLLINLPRLWRARSA